MSRISIMCEGKEGGGTIHMQNEEIASGKRIEWVDIYKGLAICLMVIGHATGRWNEFIYQFHMAAFFFISGYTLKYGEKDVLKTIWNRFYSLVLPYLSAFCLFLTFDVILSI